MQKIRAVLWAGLTFSSLATSPISNMVQAIESQPENIFSTHKKVSLSQAVIKGSNVKVVNHSQGSFKDLGNGNWGEADLQNKIQFNFQETGRDEWSVYLLDKSRNVNIQLDLFRKKIVYSDINNKFDLYTITQTSDVAQSTPTRQFPNDLPTRRPIPTSPVEFNKSQYIVAHRCNAGSWAKNTVNKQGVNAIEADFMYGRPTVFQSKGWYLAHDDVLVTSERLDKWLKDVSQLSSLVILHVDIKSPDAPLDELFDQLRAKLPNVYLIFDIGLVKEGKHLTKIKTRILQDDKAVAAMGFDDSPTAVNTFFQNEGYPLNKYWYEIGLAAGFQWSQEEQNWARDAIKARNAGKGPKVVIWTFEAESTVKTWLNEGVDAILVNSKQCYGLAGAGADADVHVRNAKNIGRYGTTADNPFK
jgi:hypothetical protein